METQPLSLSISFSQLSYPCTSLLEQFEKNLKQNIQRLEQMKPTIIYYEPLNRQVQTQTYQMFDDFQQGFRCLSTCKKTILNKEILKDVNESMMKKIKEQFVKTKGDHMEQLMKRVKFLQQKVLQVNKDKEVLIQKLTQKDGQIQNILIQEKQLKKSIAQKATDLRSQMTKNKALQNQIESLKQEIDKSNRSSQSLKHTIQQKEFKLKQDEQNLKKYANNEVLRTLLLNQIAEQDKSLSFRLQETSKQLLKMNDYIQEVQQQLIKTQNENIKLKNTVIKLSDQIDIKNEQLREVHNQVKADEVLLQNLRFLQIVEKKWRKFQQQQQKNYNYKNNFNNSYRISQTNDQQNNKNNDTSYTSYIDRLMTSLQTYFDSQQDHISQILYSYLKQQQEVILNQILEHEIKEEQLKQITEFTKIFYLKKSAELLKKSQISYQLQQQSFKAQTQNSTKQYYKDLQNQFEQKLTSQIENSQKMKQIMHMQKKQLQRQIQKLYQEIQDIKNQNEIFKHLLQDKQEEKKGLRLTIQELQIRLEEIQISHQIRVREMGMLGISMAKEKSNQLMKSAKHQKSAIRLPSFGGEDNLILDKGLICSANGSGCGNGNNYFKERDLIMSSQTPTFNRSSLDQNIGQFTEQNGSEHRIQQDHNHGHNIGTLHNQDNYHEITNQNTESKVCLNEIPQSLSQQKSSQRQRQSSANIAQEQNIQKAQIKSKEQKEQMKSKIQQMKSKSQDRTIQIQHTYSSDQKISDKELIINLPKQNSSHISSDPTSKNNSSRSNNNNPNVNSNVNENTNDGNTHANTNINANTNQNNNSNTSTNNKNTVEQKQKQSKKKIKKLTIEADTPFRRLDLPRSPQYSSKKIGKKNQIINNQSNSNNQNDQFFNTLNNNQKYAKNVRLLNQNKILQQRNKHLMIQIQKMTQYIYNLHNIGSNWRKIQKDKEKLHKFDNCLKLPQKLAQIIHKKQQINNQLQTACNTSHTNTQIKSIIIQLDKIIIQTNKWVNLFQGINKKQIERHDKLLSRIKLKKTKTLVQKHERQVKQDCYEISKCFAVDKDYRDVYSEGMSPQQECDFQFDFSPFDMELASKNRDNSLQHLFNEGHELSEISSVKNQSQISQFINSRSQFVNMFDPKNTTKAEDYDQIHPNYAYAYHDFESNHQPSQLANQTNSVPQKDKAKNQPYENRSIKSLRKFCNKEKEKVKILQKKIVDLNSQYKKLIDRIKEFNKKKMAKLQKDFNSSMTMIIKCSISQIGPDHVLQNKEAPTQIAVPWAFQKKHSRSQSKSMSLVDIHIPKRISQTQEIIEQKIQEIQEKLDELKKKYDQKQTILQTKTEQLEEVQKKIKHEKLINQKLNEKLTHQKQKIHLQKIKNKRIKNQFNQFMLKLSQKNVNFQIPQALTILAKSSFSSRVKTDETQTQTSYLKKMNSIQIQYHQENQHVKTLKIFINQLIKEINKYHLTKSAINTQFMQLKNLNQMFPIFKEVLTNCKKNKIKYYQSLEDLRKLQIEIQSLKEQNGKLLESVSFYKQKPVDSQQNLYESVNVKTLQSKTKEIKQLKEIKQMQNQNKILKHQNQKLADNLAQLISSHNQKERTSIQLHETKKLYQQLKINNQQVQNKLEELLIQNQSLSNEKKDLFQEYRQKKEEVAVLNQKILIMEGHLLELQEKINHYQVQEHVKHEKNEKNQHQHQHQNQHIQKRRSSKVVKKNSNGSLASIGDQFYQFQDQKQFNNILEQKTHQVEQLTKQNQNLKQKYQKLKSDTKPFTDKHHKTIFLDR